jgi:hypothetical protein
VIPHPVLVLVLGALALAVACRRAFLTSWRKRQSFNAHDSIYGGS